MREHETFLFAFTKHCKGFSKSLKSNIGIFILVKKNQNQPTKTPKIKPQSVYTEDFFLFTFVEKKAFFPKPFVRRLYIIHHCPLTHAVLN